MKRRFLPLFIALVALSLMTSQGSGNTGSQSEEGDNNGSEPEKEHGYCEECVEGEWVDSGPAINGKCPPGSRLKAGNDSIRFTIGLGTSRSSFLDFVELEKAKNTQEKFMVKSGGAPGLGEIPKMRSFIQSASNSANGKPVTLGFYSETIDENAFDSRRPGLYGADKNQGEYYDETSGVRQIATNECFTEIRPFSPDFGYVINIYDMKTVSLQSNNQTQGPNSQQQATNQKRYQVTGSSKLLQSYTVSKLSENEFALDHRNYTTSSTSPRERRYVWQITGTIPNHTSELRYYGRINDNTSLYAKNTLVNSDLGNGVTQRERTIQKIASDNSTFVTTAIVRDKYRNLGDGIKRIFESTNAPGTPEELTTNYTYTDIDGEARLDIAGNRLNKWIPGKATGRDQFGAGNVPAKKPVDSYLGGRISTMQRSDGYWETYAYSYSEATKLMTTEIRSTWKNSPFDSPNARVRMLYLEPTSSRMVEKIAGFVVSDISETIIEEDKLNIIRRVVSTGANTPELVSETGYFNSTGVQPGSISYRRNSDGTLSNYNYETPASSNASGSTGIANPANNTNPTTPTNPPSPTNSTSSANPATATGEMTVTELHGVIDSVQSNPNMTGLPVGAYTQGKRIVTKRDIQGRDATVSTYDIASGLLLSRWDALTFDNIGRPTKIIFNLDMNDYEETAFDCCGIASRRERDGSTTQFTRDFLGRETFSSAVIGSRTVNTANIYSSESLNGRTLPKVTRTRTTTAATNTATQFLGESISNLSGDTVLSRSPDANSDGIKDETTYTYNSNTRTTSATGPDGTTSTSTRYADGQSYTSITSVNGTAISPLITYDYAVHNLNGRGLKTTVTQSAGNLTLKTSSTYADQAGRTILTESPGHNGAILTSTPSYDERGRTIGITRTGQPAVKYVHNLLGETIETWIDANGDSEFNDTIVNNIADTCTKQNSSYVTEDGFVCEKSTQSIRTDANTDIITATRFSSTDGLYSKSLPLAGTGPITTSTALKPYVAEASGLLAQSSTRTYLTATTFLESLATTTLNADGTITATQTNKDTLGATITSASSTSDILDRTISQMGERGLTTTYANFTEAGQPLLTTHSDGAKTRITLDAAARPIKVETLDATNVVISTRHTSYHPNGQVAAQWGDLTNPTFSLYNIQGQLTELRTYKNQSTEPTAATTGFEKTNWDYEPATGLLLNKRYADNKGPDYSYTADGKLFTKTSAREVTHGIRLLATYGYDSTNRLNAIDYNDTTPPVSRTYNRLGQVLSTSTLLTDRSALITSSIYAYDPDTYALDKETITYNLPNQPSFTRIIDRSQDPLGRSEGFQLKNAALVDEQSVTYSYSATNSRLASISGGAFQAPSQTFSYGYTPNSNMIATVVGPAHQVTNTYEPYRNVLLTKSNTRNSDNTVISAVNYLVNTIGQRKERTTTDASNTSVTTAWDYDLLGQVTSENQPGTDADRAYAYDHIGNRLYSEISNTQISDPAGTNTTAYTANAINQYTSVNAFTPTYDEDGNQKAAQIKGSAGLQPATYHWDAQNRLIQVEIAGGATVTYTYDAYSRRIAQTTGTNTTLYVYDGWNCIAEYQLHNSSFILHTSLLWGLDLSGSMQGAGGVGGLLQITDHSTLLTHHIPIYDGNGNVTEYIDNACVIAASFDYDPFGNITNNNNPLNFPYAFSTKPRESETGLYYYGYRWYSPLTSRWLSRDPLEEKGGVNLYSGMMNSIINFIDILGGNPRSFPVIDCRTGVIHSPEGRQFCTRRNEDVTPRECRCEVHVDLTFLAPTLHWNPFLIDPTLYAATWACQTNIFDAVVVHPDDLWMSKQPSAPSRNIYFALLQMNIKNKIGECCIKSMEIRSHGNYGVGPFNAVSSFPDQYEKQFLEWLHSMRCPDTGEITLKACACASDPDRLRMIQIMADTTGYDVTGWTEDFIFFGFGDKYKACPQGGAPTRQ